MAHVVAVDAVKLHDELLAAIPDQARHDADTCPFCIQRAGLDRAAQDADTTSRIPPATGGPDVSDSQVTPNTEGGTPNNMPDIEQISKETHEALMSKAVSDAVQTTEKALHTITAERDELKTSLAAKTEEVANLTTDNERLNKELDTAQVGLKAAKDEVADLKADIAKKEQDAAKAEVASKRSEQVKNLALFDDSYIQEKASSWAELDDAAWTERLEEWRKLKPADSNGDGGKKTTDTASVMTGTTDTLTKTPPEKSQTPARRAALGLT
jgi:regulator of replication initiation timing